MGVALVIACGRDEPAPIEDPFEDPWVDAIDADEEQPAPAVAANSPEPGSVVGDPVGEGTPAEVAELAAASPVTEAEVAEPAVAGAQVRAKVSPSDSESPSPEAPSVQEAGEVEPGEAEPAPSVEPEPAPSVEPEPEPKPTIPPPVTSADFHGNYRYIGGQAQRDGVADAVEDTVNALSMALRGIARRRLTEVNPVEGKVDIVVAGDKVTTTFESGFTITAVIGGGAAKAKAIDGSKINVRLSAKGNKLVQQIEGKGGGRIIVYVLSDDRKTLTVHNKITSKRLPVPVTYRLSYARK